MVGRSQCFNHFSFGVQSFLVKVKSLSAINTKLLLSRDHLINFWEATKRRTKKGWLKRVRWQWNKNNSCNQLSNLGLWPKQGSYDLSDWESQNQQLAPFKQPSSPVTLSSLLSNSIWNIKEASSKCWWLHFATQETAVFLCRAADPLPGHPNFS